MHEYSIAKMIVDQVKEEVVSRGLGRLLEIQMEIGEFSGVEAALVQTAFADLAKESWEENVCLTAQVTPLTARCGSCSLEFRVQRFCFVCPRCEETNVQIVSGEEIRITAIRCTAMEEGICG